MVSSFLQIFLFIKTALIRYSMEEHYALTKDGYILTLHRIPRGREKQDDLEPTSNGHDDGYHFISFPNLSNRLLGM